MAPTKGGMIIGTSTAALKNFFPGKLYKAASTASGRAIAIDSTVVAVATLSELNSPRTTLGSSIAIWT